MTQNKPRKNPSAAGLVFRAGWLGFGFGFGPLELADFILSSPAIWFNLAFWISVFSGSFRILARGSEGSPVIVGMLERDWVGTYKRILGLLRTNPISSPFTFKWLINIPFGPGVTMVSPIVTHF